VLPTDQVNYVTEHPFDASYALIFYHSVLDCCVGYILYYTSVAQLETNTRTMNSEVYVTQSFGN